MTMLLTLLLSVVIPYAPTDRVSDGAQLLSTDARAEVVQLIARAEQEQHIRLAVITFSQLDVDPKVAALRTLEEWPLGPRSVVLLISMQPKKIFIQPGMDFRYQLDEANASAIAREQVARHMRAGQFETAVMSGLSSSLQRVAMEVRPATTRTTPEGIAQIYTAPAMVPPAEPLSFGAKFGLFLLASAVIFAVITLVRRAKRRARQAELDAASVRPFRSPAISSVDYNNFPPMPPLLPAFGQPQYASVNPPPTAGVMPIIVQSANNDMLNAVVVSELLSRPASAPAPAPVPYVPPARTYSPPPAPAYEPPSHHSHHSHHDSGGGGSSWSSDDSSSGGGGSSFDSGGSDSGGGGGGFDSGGGGGGGSDF